ncbi:MAG: glycosyltransferase family 2 protein [Candidatus Saccharimonadales bacterium]
MSLGFKLFWIINILELALWLSPSLSLRRVLAPAVMIWLAAVSVAIVYSHPSLPTGLILLISAYRICNLTRLLVARIQERYLRRVVVQSSLWLIGIQALLLLLWQISSWLTVSTYSLWLSLAYADLIGCLILFMSTNRHLRTTHVPKLSKAGIADRDLPTLSVAIPARNENEDLDECLGSLIKSNYPKLEILVLDDCSQNKHTPEIIRSFAHDGVRFIQGNQPKENWLAKNQAYQQLFEESSGELILFCGVDVRFKPDSLRQLVMTMLYKQKSMVSIIPANAGPTALILGDSTLLQPIRYAWELAIPRRLLQRTPIISTCWIIRRESLESAGSFAAVSRSIVPESYFARSCAVHDGYSFMQSNQSIGLTTSKVFIEQRNTAIRTRYPQVHRRLELVMVVTLLEAFGILMPYGLILLALLGHLSLQLIIIGLLAVVTLTICYGRIVTLTFRKRLLRSLYLLPLAIIFDVILLNYSMIRYEFFSVVWKGRNICIPVMRSILRPSG